MTWRDISIEKYQQLYPILSRKICNLSDELEQKQDIIAFFEGKPREHYEDMKAKAFDELWAKYDFLTSLPKQRDISQVIDIDGHTFLFDYNSKNVAERLKARDVIELSTVAGDEKIVTEKMDLILLGHLKHKKKHFWSKALSDEDKLSLIRKLDMDTAYNITAFFLPLLNSYLKGIQTYSIETLKKTSSQIAQSSH